VLLDRDPQVIIAPQMASLPVTVESLHAKPGWKDLRAFQTHRVHILNGDLMSRCGPRLVEALERMAHAAYPERFPLPEAESP
jgi:iron complex transport system substrate-binding protein